MGTVIDELHKIEQAFSAHFGALSAPAISIDAKEALESLRRVISQIAAGAASKTAPVPQSKPEVHTPPAKPAPPKPTGAK
jgi:hypothetical protein